VQDWRRTHLERLPSCRRNRRPKRSWSARDEAPPCLFYRSYRGMPTK
jgi:hypothetical protein